MKIVDSKYLFQDLPDGSLVMYNGKYYMKICQIGIPGNPLEYFNAICMEDYKVYKLPFFETSPINCKLVINPLDSCNDGDTDEA